MFFRLYYKLNTGCQMSLWIDIPIKNPVQKHLITICILLVDCPIFKIIIYINQIQIDLWLNISPFEQIHSSFFTTKQIKYLVIQVSAQHVSIKHKFLGWILTTIILYWICIINLCHPILINDNHHIWA